MANAMGLRPGHERPACELWTVAGTHSLRIPAKQCSPIQHPGHVLTRDAKVHCDVHALVAEVIGHREVLQTPAAREAVAHKIHAPHLVDRACQLQRHTLVIDSVKLPAQQVVDAPVAKAATQMWPVPTEPQNRVPAANAVRLMRESLHVRDGRTVSGPSGSSPTPRWSIAAVFPRDRGEDGRCHLTRSGRKGYCRLTNMPPSTNSAAPVT